MASTADAKGVGGVFSKNTQAWTTAARVVMLGAPLAVGDRSWDGAYESRPDESLARADSFWKVLGTRV